MKRTLQPIDNQRRKNGLSSTAARPLMFLLFLLWLSAWTRPVLAQPGATSHRQADTPPIQVTADRLTARQDSRTVQFSGHVRAVHGDTTITADTLQVVYQPRDKKTAAPGNAPVTPEAIERIVAEGRVTIVMADKTATCHKAVYETKTRVMTLTGAETRIQSGGNYITGHSVTLHQDSGEIIVDGNGGTRVNAVFQPEGGPSLVPGAP